MEFEKEMNDSIGTGEECNTVMAEDTVLKSNVIKKRGIARFITVLLRSKTSLFYWHFLRQVVPGTTCLFLKD